MSLNSQTSNKNSNSPQKYYLEGLQLLKKRKPRQAIPLLKKALDLNPDYHEAEKALQEAYKSLDWNTSYFCGNCGHFIHPTKTYPDIKLPASCSWCGQKVSTQLENILGIGGFSVKLLLFGMFPFMTLILSFFPQWTAKHGGVYLEYTPIISSIFNALNYTPFFVILFLLIDPTGNLLNQAYYTTLRLLQPAQIHPLIIFAVQIVILFGVIYSSLLVIFTPIVYMHKKGYWKSKEHQKRIVMLSSIMVGIIVLRRISLAVFQ